MEKDEIQLLKITNTAKKIKTFSTKRNLLSVNQHFINFNVH